MKTLAPHTTNRVRLALAARAIEPLLNRVVFTGRQVAELLAAGPLALGPRATFASDARLQVLTTTSLDRVAVDLQRRGLRRTGRGATHDQWALDEQITLDVTFVSGDESDRAMLWLEYAALLTVAVELETGLTARVTGAPALLALDLAAFRASGESPLDSAELEDVVALVASRSELVREVGAAPPELRSFVANEARRFLGYDGAVHVIRCALPRAMRFAALTARVGERFRRIASLS